MRKISLALVCFLFVGSLASAQVLSPGEIGDDIQRALQEKYFDQLRQFGDEARAHKFPYAFSFSRVLDLEQSQQAAADQRSIRFDSYSGKVVLEITGNYYASYSSQLMDYNHRVRQDFTDVVLPLLKMAAPRCAKVEGFQAYAFEISHHVRHKIIGVDSESAENVVFIFSRDAAERLVKASTPEQQQAAVLDSEILVDGDRFSMWLTGIRRRVPSAREKAKRNSSARKSPAYSCRLAPRIQSSLLSASSCSGSRSQRRASSPIKRSERCRWNMMRP